MSKLPNMVPVTDLRQDATSILKKATTSRQPIIITQRGRAAAVLVSVEAYEHSQHEREILRLLARGEMEIKAGKGHDLASVLAEADELLKGE
jgi:prevent-host-death family protein